jgi:VIT1/CCC1 family predicted Fe2+/Mn2+ transporter
MIDMTNSGMKSPLNFGSEIYSYKRMLSVAFKMLALKTLDQSTNNLLRDLSSREANDAVDWKKSLDQFTGISLFQTNRFIKQRVRLMMGILGPRGFFEWVLIAEDEAVEKLMISAGMLEDKGLSDHLTRVVSDERLHVIQMKKDVLGMEGWEMGESGGIRDVIFGANDGLVSILALVAGVYGAVTDSQLILITGIAGAIAGTISMGAGAYLSAKSEKEVTQKENTRKGIVSGTQDQKRTALVEIYRQQGMNQREAEAVADRVAVELETQSQQTIGEVIGLTTEDDWPPTKAGLLTGLSFLFASVVPIMPFAFLQVTAGAITAMIASIVTLFAVGASKAVFTRSSWVRSGLENLAIGVLAAAATYVIGILIPGI